MHRNGYVSWLLALTLTLVASQQALAGDNAPGASSQEKAAAAEAVARSAEYAGQAADETDDCGGLAFLLEAVPAAHQLLGMDEVYRGCESPVTVNLQYAADAAQLSYTLGILDAQLAELPKGREYWQSILDVNRESVQSLISAQGKLAQAQQGKSKRVTLSDGSTAVVFREGRDWALVAMPGDRYALRIDLGGASAGKAHDMLVEAAAALDMAVLDR
jgi:hypothetical protein